MDGSLTNNYTIYLMLILCVILLTVDVIELYKVILNWSFINKYDPIIFQTCVKKELILKTIFAVFSFLSAICAFILCFFLSINTEFFINKLLTTYVNLLYFIFGPYMLGFAIFGLINWNEVVFLCDRKNNKNIIFSLSNSFSLLGCFLISLTVTIGVIAYESVMLYIESILRRSGGNKIIRSLFWWAVLRSRPEVLRGNPNGEMNENNTQPNIPNIEQNNLNNEQN